MTSLDRLLQIGSFARLAGVAPSRLRFYADCGLVPPRRTDPVSVTAFTPPSRSTTSTSCAGCAISAYR